MYRILFLKLTISSPYTFRIIVLANLASQNFTSTEFDDKSQEEFKILLQDSGQFSGKIILVSKPDNIDNNHF